MGSPSQEELMYSEVKKWVETQVLDKQRITDRELEKFLVRLAIDDDIGISSPNEEKVREAIDKINETLPEDEPPIGLLKDIIPRTPKYIPKPKQDVGITYNPVSLIKLFGESEKVDGISILPLVTTKTLEDIYNQVKIGYSKKFNIDENERREMWNDFLDKNELTSNELADSLRFSMTPVYAKLLILFLKVFKNNIQADLSSACSEILHIVETIFVIRTVYDDKTVYYKPIDPETFSGDFKTLKTILLNDNDLETFITTNLPNITQQNKQSLIDYVKIHRLDNTKKQLKAIKQEFVACKNQYYMIPYGIVRFLSTGHQNLIILDKVNKQVIYIEPQYYGNTTKVGKRLTDEQNKRLDRLLQEFGIPEYQRVLPVTVYPQSIAYDENCMFWTFLITVTFLMNPSVRNPDLIAQAIIKKYPTQQTLIEYIEGFRAILGKMITIIPPEGGKRKRTRRVKRVYRKKSTLKKRVVSK